jgi:cyanophycinase-like exopeptidase
MSDTPIRVVLGPQNPVRNFGRAVNESGIPDGQVAVITAAWQEAENDIDEMRSIVGRPLVDLELYRRAEDVFHADPALAADYRERQDRLKEQQRLYRSRLRPLALAARRMLRHEGDREIVAAEQRHAIAQLRALDRHQLNRCEALMQPFHAAFDARLHEALAAHRREIRAIVDASSAVLITGGNVAILINRLRLFGLAEVLAPANVVAWSAGAMVLAERIVLYHERLPQGRHDPEVFGAGLGLLPGHVILPDPKHRLRAGDRLRIGLMARRFSPDVCLALDNDTAVYVAGDRLVRVEGARRLTRKGRLGRIRTA